MVLELKYWRVYCKTEEKEHFIWSKIKPTTCPINSEHEINPQGTIETNSISQNEVRILEETVKTGGMFKVVGYTFTVPPNSTAYDVHVFDYPASVLTGIMKSDNDPEIDDVIDLYLKMEGTNEGIIGIITQNVNPGDTEIHVSPGVVNNLRPGWHISLCQTDNYTSTGNVINKSSDKHIISSLDLENNIIHLVQPWDEDIRMAGPIPTYIQFWIFMVTNFYIGPNEDFIIGTSSVGGAYMKKNRQFRFRYRNNHPTKERKIRYRYEMLY